MKKIWSSPWRPYWLFSFVLVAAAAFSWWQSSSHWKGARTVASYDFSQIHPDFLANLDEHLYTKYKNKHNGTFACKHYSFPHEKVKSGKVLEELGADLKKYCIKGTALVTGVAQDVMEDQQIFVGCCDLNNPTGAVKHFRYEQQSSGNIECKRFTLENEHSGVYSFFSEVGSYVNKYCHPATVLMTEILSNGSFVDQKDFAVCCELNK